MRNCKLGDLAVVVKALHPENIGKIVHIFHDSGLIEWHGFEAPTWVWGARTIGSGLTYTYGEKKRKHQKNCGEIPDAYLRPIKPLEEDTFEEDLREIVQQ